ncbi:MAG: hypothetical protein H5U08_06730 [Thermogutta sp.]|uniref:hypothetical protein n=1 Tax=Thermogutta sp. TaxID=1962930 RepID=UPI00198CB2C2|nr:hypothetical protein [Thermogutta sp.]MBC7352036.1 hypothetical protein [Thermogutta sp.]
MKSPFLAALVLMVSLPICVCGEPSPPTWPSLPVPRIRGESIDITFAADTSGFQALNQCRLSVRDGVLVVESFGEDPYLARPLSIPADACEVIVELRTTVSTGGAVYWTCGRSSQWGEDKVRHFPLQADGQWHEYRVEIVTPGGLKQLRLDPGAAPGVYEIRRVRVTAMKILDVAVGEITVTEKSVRFDIINKTKTPVFVIAENRKIEVPAEDHRVIEVPRRRDRVLEGVAVEIQCPEMEKSLRRVVWVYDDSLPADWTVVPGDLPGGCRLEVSPQDNAARIRRGQETLVAIAPIVAPAAVEGPGFITRVPKLSISNQGDNLALAGEGVRAQIHVRNGEVAFDLEATNSAGEEVEGPVVRPGGLLEQGLFAGLEYLGKGERSSSTLDIETEEHIRFAPDPIKVTMPLMAFVTDRTGVALSWDDMHLQPIYATPNVFDGTADHRMALRGHRINAVLRVGDSRLEEQILWAVQRKGLPALPEPPRGRDAQRQLCLWALTEGPIHNENGWGHCVEPNWVRRFHVDMVSTIWRLSGKLPEVPELVPGGAHLPDEAAWFLTGRAEQWLQITQNQLENVLRQQREDGSFRYQGPYQKGHFEDTASGYCGRFAVLLLDAAYVTGNKRTLEAGIKTLEYMKRFRTPRGAQTWELSLHTPDILASAHLVHAYVRGYQLTGNREYLQLARRWALTGIPFVYLWGEYPVMLYATIPVYGATNWRAPNWIGLPVQWCGLVYAYSLTLLAPYDNTLDWHRLAEGILIAGEQMQVPREEGDYAGLLPDSFHIRLQRRQGPFINPCALVNLRLALDGKPHRLEVAADEAHRVVSPFPVRLEGRQAVIQGQAGTRYQIVVDGQRVISVDSRGTDVVPLD